MWCMSDHTTEEQARINRGRINNGAVPKVENTSKADDADVVDISVESSRVVHASTRPNNSAVSSGECGHGGNDRCVCGVAIT